MSNFIPSGILVKQIHDRLEKHANNSMRSRDLTLAQGAVLMELNHCENQTAALKKLEQSLHVAQSTAAGIVARLEQKGFVESFGDPFDKRIKLVHLTPQGADSCKQSQKDMESMDRLLLSCLTAEEEKMLHLLLQKVCDHMK